VVRRRTATWDVALVPSRRQMRYPKKPTPRSPARPRGVQRTQESEELENFFPEANPAPTTVPMYVAAAAII
jgi:hypothetical protein